MQEFYVLLLNIIKNISIWSVVDIAVVSYIFYKAFLLIKETRAEQVLKGVILIIALLPISSILKLDVLNFILTKTLTIGVLSVVIIKAIISTNAQNPKTTSTSDNKCQNPA